MRTFDLPSVDSGRLSAIEPTLLHLVVAATLGVFTDLGVGRFAKLLDAIAETEHFHELTMID